MTISKQHWAFVKNISEPIRIYRLLMGSENAGKVIVEKPVNEIKKKLYYIALAATVILIVRAGLFINRYINPIPPSEVSTLKNETAPAEKPSIAVLPFVNMSDDPKNEYFSDGMAEEILNGLSKLSGLVVKARTSSFKFKGKNEDVRKIGEILNVTHVLEGSVRKSGNEIRVTAQLISTKEDAHIWSGQYDRELTDVFAIQDDITGAILKELNIHLLGSHKKQKPTNNMEAYEAYLMGRQRILKDTITSQAEAIEYFQKAVDLDNDFALAYVGLADSCMYHMIYSGLPRDEWLIRAENAIERALKIDDQLGEAYNSLGVFRSLKSNDTGTATDNKEAETAFKRALELNPNYFDTYYNYGDYLRSSNRFKEALVWHKKGIELDPLNTGIITTSAGELIGLGRFDEALKQYDRVIEIDPFYPSVYSDKGSLYSSLGKLYEAARMFRKAISLEPDTPYHAVLLGNVYANLGDLKQAGYWSEQAIKMNPDSLYSNMGMFEHSVLLGEEESAKKYGRKILELTRKKYITGYVLNYFQDLDLKAGRYNEARKWFADAYPELLDTKTVNIGLINYESAISFAHALINKGEKKHANLLLNKSLEYIKTLPRLGGYGYGIADARICMLQGKKKETLDSLREAVDSGWREDWKYYLELESIKV
jgi:TolB-like protein/Tfp pilus assembly protein PilF